MLKMVGGCEYRNDDLDILAGETASKRNHSNKHSHVELRHQ